MKDGRQNADVPAAKKAGIYADTDANADGDRPEQLLKDRVRQAEYVV